MSDFKKEIEAKLARGIEKAAIHLMNKIKEKINRDQPYWIGKGPKGRWYHGEEPSAPGEPPKKIRGDLQRSISYEIDKENLSAKVGSNLDYALYLELGTSEMSARPYLRATLNEEAATLAKIIARG